MLHSFTALILIDHEFEGEHDSYIWYTSWWHIVDLLYLITLLQRFL